VINEFPQTNTPNDDDDNKYLIYNIINIRERVEIGSGSIFGTG
jgi:hypothetical protein